MSSGGAGTAAAGLKFGGASAGAFTGVLTASEEWNGSAWVASPGNLNTARGYLSGFGTQTAALGAGGYTSPPTIQHTNSETYDGSTWTAANAMPIGRMMAAASGTQTAAFYYGGNTDLPTGIQIVDKLSMVRHGQHLQQHLQQEEEIVEDLQPELQQLL